MLTLFWSMWRKLETPKQVLEKVILLKHKLLFFVFSKHNFFYNIRPSTCLPWSLSWRFTLQIMCHMRFKSMGGWCWCGCKRWVWKVRWGMDLKAPSSGIWVIKMRIIHERFIFVTGNFYSCAHGTSLNIRLSWGRLTIIMVKHPLHIKMPLGSSIAMIFLFLVVPKNWQWMSFKSSFEIMLKNIAIHICHHFSGAVVFESSALCEIWSAEEMWSIWHVICI